ncbi:glycosyltransferase family 2 protein [Olivibacter sitiensis]|uniref:glycosyltransferase family 2 protein n=1 Tax=Olivibacter sitiensis TaxID=376470 RepID=UPI0003FCA4A7|nr:glycosyltransferase [Olivibacter sitiensis]
MLVLIGSFALFLSFCYLITLVCFHKGWKGIDTVKEGGGKACSTLVSVLIAARNEEGHIGETIACLLNQDYPRELLEIIIIDDHSTDNTAEIIERFKNQGIKLIRLNEKEPLNSYKKKAISVGIGQARGQLIVATDADCHMGPRWISTIVEMYECKKFKLISAPVVCFREKSLFERLQTLEFLYLIGLGASTIGLKRPSTCNGANMAYERSVFYELGGFNGIDDLASGDDELFLHKVAEKYPDGIGFCKSRDAVVYTEAKENLASFISQRRRWASKSTRYKNKWVVLLGVGIWTYNLLLFVLMAWSLFRSSALLWLLGLLTMKCLAEYYFIAPLASFAKRKSLMSLLPLLTILHVVYMVYIGIMGNIGKYSWKGRRVK